MPSNHLLAIPYSKRLSSALPKASTVFAAKKPFAADVVG